MAIIPSSIGSWLESTQQGISDVFTNVGGVVQSVDSVYDQLTGQSDSAPKQTTATNIPASSVAPASNVIENTMPVKVGGLSQNAMIGIAAVVVIGIVFVLR